MSLPEVALGAALGAVAVGLIVVLRWPRRGDDEVAPLVQAQSVRLDRMADALGRQAHEDVAFREGLGRTREVLDQLRVRTEERRRAEEAGWESVRRLEAVLLGGAARGRAGENVLEDALSDLPPGMVVRGFRVNGKEVEFALVLPDGRRLPVDSKWTALREVEALANEEDAANRAALCRRIEDEVARRAREVAGYLEASLTTPFAVAAVPDAAYAVCRRAHAEAFARGVVLVPYSTVMPVLLSLHALAARYGRTGDVQSCLAELDGILGAMENTLENKVARATAMLQNASDEWRTHVGRARGSLARGRGLAPVDSVQAQLEDAESPDAPATFVDFDRSIPTR